MSEVARHGRRDLQLAGIQPFVDLSLIDIHKGILILRRHIRGLVERIY